MSGFDTPFSPSFVVGLTLLLGLGMWWAYRPLLGRVGTRQLLLLAGLRLTSVAALLLFLLQPYRMIETPDRDAFRVIVLADASQSMAVEDGVDGRSRFDHVRELLAGEPAAVGTALTERYQVRTLLFSDHVREVATADEPVLMPGSTALGDVLRDVLRQDESGTIGAVLVLSDGRVNTGGAATEASKLFRAANVPISAIGIGGAAVQGDVTVRFVAERVAATKGQPLTVQVRVGNTMPVAAGTRLTVSLGAVTASRELKLAPRTGEAVVEIPLTPIRAGFQTISARLEPLPGDRRPDTDVDYMILDVEEPPVFRVLYLGGALTWEYRFLKHLADLSEQLSLAVVLRTSPSAVFVGGLPPEHAEPGFPTRREVFQAFDAVLLDTRLVPELPEATAAALLGFVDDRGGGLLFFGPTSGLRAPFDALSPVGEGRVLRLADDQWLEFSAGPLFGRAPGTALPRRAAFTVRHGDLLHVPETVKPGARVVAQLRGERLPLLVAQSYGSGRTAFLGMEDTWRWRLASADGPQVHDAFWNALFMWLGSTRKRPLEAANDGVRVGIGEPVALDVDVLGADFRPASDARVQCVVTDAAGNETVVALGPAAEVAGRYTGMFFPERPGEHTATYQARLPDRSLTLDTHFVARHGGIEAENTDYAPETLRDMCRITGGRFWHVHEPRAGHALPLSPKIPLQRRPVALLRTGWFMIALLALLACDWACRRRIGLT